MNTAKGMYVDGNPVYFKDDNVRNFISDEYSEDKTYAVGDYCINDNKLYMCTAPTSGGFDGSCWKQTNMSVEVSKQNKNLYNVSKKISDNIGCIDAQIVSVTTDTGNGIGNFTIHTDYGDNVPLILLISQNNNIYITNYNYANGAIKGGCKWRSNDSWVDNTTFDMGIIAFLKP